MNGQSLRILQVLLWVVCASHIIIGGGIMISPAFQQQMEAAYGASMVWTDELSYLARILGVFMLGFGVVGIAAAIDPLRYRVLVYGFAGVMLIRAGQRIVHQNELQVAFGLDAGRLWLNAAFFALLAIALIVLLHLATSQPRSASGER